MLNDLRRIVEEVNAAPNLQDALQVIVQRVRGVLKCEVCSIYLRDKEGYLLTATEGLNPDAVGKVCLKPDQGLVGLVAEREEPLNLEWAEVHPRYCYFPETGEERYSSFLGAPIVHHRKVLGVFVIQQRQRRRFDESDEAFLMTMSAQLAGVIAHALATGALRHLRGEDEELLSAKFIGVPGSQGIAQGEMVVLRPSADLFNVSRRPCEDIPAELNLFHDSLQLAREDVRRLGQQLAKKLDKSEQALFDAYISLLDDNTLADEVVRSIEAGSNAQQAWSNVILAHIGRFDNMDDSYLRERAADLRDLGQRVLGYLQRYQSASPTYPERTILVAEEVVASMLGEIPEDKLVGIVSAQGSVNSHVAIVARALGVPAVVGVLDFPVSEVEGLAAIVDGHEGSVYTAPHPGLQQHYTNLQLEDEELMRELAQMRDLDACTQDGHRVALWVNTGLMVEVLRSLKHGAEGVGLYRTEIPFLMRDRFPSEEEQRQLYREQLEAFAPAPVTMRTLDIGGDKALPYFPIHEDNPFLGWRGIRVTLDHPEIFLAQIRAMLKASVGLDNLRILLPMISNLEEVDNSLALISRAVQEVREEHYDIVAPNVGVMIEVPAMVYMVEELAEKVDFLSVGTNDLTQYLLAVDRNNPRVADLYWTYHPAVLEALSLIAERAKQAGRELCICGEFAGDPGAALLLVAMGYDILSMSATNLLKVKASIRSFSMDEIHGLLAEVQRLPDARSISRVVKDTLRDAGLGALVGRL